MEGDTVKPLLPLGLDPDEQAASELEDQKEVRYNPTDGRCWSPVRNFKMC